jgi:transposase-like protein
MTRAPKKESKPGKPGPKQWTGAEKLRVVHEAHGLSESALGALLRREGLHAAQLAAWQAAAEAALADAPRARRGRAAPSAEAKRITVLARALRRKENALAATAALLVLKKNAEAWWAAADDTTPEPSDS